MDQQISNITSTNNILHSKSRKTPRVATEPRPTRPKSTKKTQRRATMTIQRNIDPVESPQWDSDDDMQDLLAAVEAQRTPSPRSQAPTQAPVVAPELRDSIQHLATLRAEDPISQKTIEDDDDSFQRRPEPIGEPTQKKAKTNIIPWDSDSESDEGM